LPNRYYGSFAPGLQNFIAEILGEGLPGLKIVRLLDGAVIFETAASYDRLNFFCFNNIFQVIDMRDCRRAADRESWIGGALSRGRGSPVIGENSRKIRSFRVIFSRENVPTPLSGKLRNQAENRIARESGLRVNRSLPDTEFWFLFRREGGEGRDGPGEAPHAGGTGPGLGLFMKRLTRHPSFDKSLHKGELPPPIAWTLCRLSNPKAGERVADPFCGYGAIPQARLRHFPPGEFFASDIDSRALTLSREKFGGKPPPHCHFDRIDAGQLNRIIPPASLDAIITDPPWGFHEKLPCPPEEFYTPFLAVFAGLLKDGGAGVFLCGRGEEFRAAGEKTGFTLTRNIPILLSGKKAEIFVLRKGATGQQPSV
jgi:predicted RNA methylase